MPAVSATTVAVAALGVGLAGTGASAFQQRKAQKEQKKARRAQDQQQEIQNRRSRRAAIREAQIKREQVLNFAAAGDFEGSSSVQQARGSISSQLGTNIGFSEAISAGNRNISAALGRAQSAQFGAGIAQSIGGLGFQASSFAISNPDQTEAIIEKLFGN